MDPILMGVALIGVLAVLILLKVRQGKQSGEKATGKKAAAAAAKKEAAATEESWEEQVDQVVEGDDDMGWEWSAGGIDDSDAVTAQEVDPLTEYQVYRQFGYDDKAAASLVAYLDTLPVNNVPVKLVGELADLSLGTGNIDLLSDTLTKYANLIAPEKLAEYIKAGLSEDVNHLGLRVLAESRLSWDVQDVDKQVGEAVAAAGNHQAAAGAAVSAAPAEAGKAGAAKAAAVAPLIIGRGKMTGITLDEMGAVIGFVKPELSAKLLQRQIAYNEVIRYYDRAIKQSEKPASIIIDALKLDYQNTNLNNFAAHLWRLHQALGQYGRQVKERMLGWGYNLGHHALFDALEKSPNEQQLREIGIAYGYVKTPSRNAKANLRELVARDDSVITHGSSPAEMALKEAESLLMYGQLDYAVSTLEDAILKYPQESQLYLYLFDLYERAEDWARLEQFLKVLREQEVNLPEEVVVAMGQLLQRVNQKSK